MSRTCFGTPGLPPLAVSVFVCRDVRSAFVPNACATGTMRHNVGFGDLAQPVLPNRNAAVMARIETRCLNRLRCMLTTSLNTSLTACCCVSFTGRSVLVERPVRMRV